MSFNADTSRAKASIAELQKTLQKLVASTQSTPKVFDTDALREASKAASELQQHLAAATDVNTGRLNLSTFSASLKTSNKTLDDYRRKLEAIGPAGENAFLKVSKSIALADAPLRKTNEKLQQFAVTLKNTARWQISSSVLHGFLGTIQSAYSYAQDLNESLNNIRIVTGASVEEMDKFAARANKAAQSLSTSTTAYTNAALIFYQQGIRDNKEIEERTNAVIKMSNVTGDSAEEVSSYMTAIWNNFDDGSESLEHYADVITALGASTASSSAEIAAGLEKFASIGKTIGLSYDYATSALATIVANTRQSADSVGTGLRTIFSRLQGLSLGETLEDGVDLNKYSKALKTVGVDILDATGNMRQMDDILEDLASKWDNLSEAQQTALAQTVGGVRQYTTLIALMNNWDDMEMNLNTAETADGSLQEQADIYAESWEASQKRVKAALQDIYATLIDDKFFIGMNNAFATLLQGIKGVIDGFGGVKSIVLTIASIMTQKLAREASSALERVKQDLLVITTLAKEQADTMQSQNYKDLQTKSDSAMTSFNEGQGSLEYAAETEMLELIAQKKQQLNQYTAQYSEAERKAAEQELSDLQQTAELLQEQGARYDQLAGKASKAYDSIVDHILSVSNADEKTKASLIEMIDNIQDLARKSSQLNRLKDAFKGMDIKAESKSLVDFKDKLLTIARSAASVDSSFKPIAHDLETLDLESSDARAALETLANELQTKIPQGASEATTQLTQAQNQFNNLGTAATGVSNNQLTAFINILKEMGIIAADVPLSLTHVGASMEDLKAHSASSIEGIMSFSSALMQCKAFMSSMTSLADVFTDEDATVVEKIGAAVGAMTSAFMLFNAISKTTSTLMALQTKEKQQATIASFLHAAAGKEEVTTELAKTHPILANIAAKIAETAANWGLNASMAPLLIVTLALTAAMIALTAVIAGIVAIVKAVSDAYNHDAIMAEKAEAAARGLADAYNEAKNKYQDMLDTMDKYQSARDALDSLTIGTQEYTQALLEANEAALQLIEKGGLQSGTDYSWQNGQLVIDDAALTRAQQAMQTNVAAAQAASVQANAQAASARHTANMTDFARDNFVEYTPDGYAYTDYAAASDAVNELAEAYKLSGEAAFEGVEGTQDYVDSLKTMVSETVALEEQRATAARIAAEAQLSIDPTYQASENKDKIGTAAGRIEQQAYDAAYQERLKQAGSRGAFNTGNAESEQNWKDYIQASGLDQLTNLKVENFKGSGDSASVVYSYLDENGQKQEAEVTAQQIAMQLAAADAAEQLGNSANELIKTFNRLEASTDLADHALSDFLGGELTGASRNEMDDMASDFNGQSEITSDDAMSYLTSKFGEDFDPTAYGYETADQMAQAFMEQYNNAMAAWDSIELPEGLGDWANNMSLEAAQNLENSLTKINLGPAGEAAGEEFVAGLNQMLEGVDAKDQQNALNSLMDIDWSSYDALEQAKALLADYGVEINLDSEYWKAFAENMRTAAGAQPDFTTIKQDLIDISTILNSLDFGKVIKDEDYQKLIAYNSEWEKFFILQADGTRKFIGDSQQMLQQTRAEINARREELEMRREAAEALEKWGYTDDTGNFVQADWGQYAEEAKNGGARGTAENLMNAGGAVEELLTSLGYTDEVIQEILNDTEHGSERLAVMFNRMNEAADPATLNTLDTDLNEMMASTASNLAELNHLYEQGDVDIDAYNKRVTELAANVATNSSTLEELRTGLGELGGSTDVSDTNHYDEYAQGLLNIASKYESCSEAAEQYQNALNALASATDDNREAIEKQVRTAQDNLEALIGCEEAAKKYGLEADTLTAHMNEIADAEGVSKKEALELAVANERMNRGVATLVNNWKNWKKILQTTDRTAEDYAATLADVSDAVGELIGWYDDLSLDSKFVEKNMDLIDKAATGDVQAILELGAAVASLTVQEAELNTTLADGALADGGQNAFQQYIQGAEDAGAAFQRLQGELSTAFNSIQSHMDELMAGAKLEDILGEGGVEGFVEQLNAYAAATGMTASEMQQMLSSVGVTANVESDYQEQKMTVPTYTDQITNIEYQHIPVTRADGSKGEAIEPIYTRASVPGPPIETTGYVEVASIQMEGIDGTGAKVQPPKFTGKRAPSNTAKSGGTGNKPGKSGGGGGGGGSDKPKEHNSGERKDVKDEKERYHVIKNQLEDLTSQYDRISKAKDRAFGSARLANLNKEIEAQKKLNNANKKYLEEIESYLGTDKAVMAGHGAQFDANGTITNYDALIQNAVNEYNAAVEAFNQAYTDDEGAKAAMEAAEKRYEQFMKDLEQYEETQDLYKDQLQQTIDDANVLRDLLLERTQLQVELKVDVAEDSLKLLEQLFDNIENKAYDAAEAFGYLNQMTGSYFDQLNAYNSGLQSLFANQGLSEDDFNKFVNGDTATFNRLVDMLSDGESAGFSAEDVSTIREYLDGLLEANENLREIRQTVHEQILTVWEEWGEKIDAGISKIEHLQAITESYQNIIDIVGQKNLGVSDAFMSRMRQQSIDQANDKLVAEKARYDELRKARDAAYAKFEEQKAKGILSPEEIKTWEDSLAQMDEDVNSASEDFQSAWEEALNGINEAFEAEVQQIVDAYSDAAAGLLSSISELQEAFDRRSDLASQYLEDYEKIYQFNKLNRDIEKSVDETDNVRAKKELLELQSKITALQEAGVDISKYEMEQLRQEYELKKAQIELEEAQDSKSQVQMQRDSDGNYSYVYTANTDDVANAEANYADKLHDMQVSNAEYIQDLQSNMVQMEQDYQDKVQEIMSDTSLSAEERMAKLNEVNQYYDEKMKFYISEAQLWEQNSQRLYEQDWTNYATMTGYKISEEDKWLDHWNETQLSLLTGFDTLEEYQSNHNVNVANLLLESGVAFATWQTNIETAMNNAGTSIGTFEKDATEELQTVAEESDKLKDSIVNMSTDAHQAIRSIVEEVGNWENSYSKTIQNMLTKNKALITSFNQLLAAWSKVETATPNNNSDSGNNGSNSGNDSSNSGNGNNNSGSGNGSGGSNDNSAKAEGVAAAIWMDGGASGWGNGSSRSAKLAEKGVAAAQAYINAHGPNGDIYRDWVNKRGQLKQYYYGAFDTGGYTGAWGAEGKFAMLHEKELVLNKEDTANFLQAIGIIRQISDTIDLNALSSSGGLSSLFAATASSSAQTLQQEVTIHAEFPNATDRNEISAAFSDLVNLASQYANRK